MPLNRPTLTQIITRIREDIASEVPGSDLTFPRSLLRIIGNAEAGAIHEVWGRLAWVVKQIFPDTADGEFLERWSSIWGIHRDLATSSTGVANVENSTTGTTIPAGTVLSRADGALFTVDEEVTIDAGGEAEIALTAEEGGTDGDTDAEATLTFQSPISGVASTAEVGVSGITGGTDLEDDSSLLLKLLARIQEPPAGGAAHDYPVWCQEVAGVTRGWVSPLYDPTGAVGYGMVGIVFAMDEKETYPDLVRGGTFASDIADWYKETAGGGGWSITGGRAVCDGAQTSAVTLYQDVDATATRTYRVKFTISGATAGTVVVKLGATTVGTYNTWPGHNTDYDLGTIVAGAGTYEGQLRFEADSGFDGSIDDVQVLDEVSLIVPGASEIDDVHDYLGTTSSETGVRPVCVQIHMLHLEAQATDFDITLLEASTDAIKAAIQANLEDLLFTEGYPNGKLYVSHVREAISSAAGEVDHVLNTINGSSPADITLGFTEILTLGTITWS